VTIDPRRWPRHWRAALRPGLLLGWCLLPGLLVAQVELLLRPGVGARDVASLVVKLTLASALALLFLGVVLTMAGGRRAGAPAGHRWLLGPWPVLGGATAAIAAPLLRQPARLTLTLYCFVLAAGATWWVVRRSGGAPAAAGAVGGLTLLALVATTSQYPSMRFAEDWRPDSTYKWAVGWPTESWRVRHTVQLPRPAPARALRLRLFLARAYDGPARVYGAVNGRAVGEAQLSNEVHVDVPAAVVAGSSRLEFELRLAPVDPRLRLLATRWSQGASLGGAASGYFDGVVWLPGTFNDATGLAQPGVLAAHLEVLE
jgi:hypothetical protein